MDKLDCGHEPSEHSDITTGYGEDDSGKTYCYACCADRDREAMVKNGRITLYLSFNPDNQRGEIQKPGYRPCGSRHVDTWQVSNWPGSLKFNAYVTIGRHNIDGKRYDAYFNGPDGFRWHGVQYGDNTQLIHCKRTKEKIAS